MMEKFRQIWKATEVRNSVLYVLAMLFVYRLAAHVPIPGVNASGLREFFQQNQALGFINLLSGGGMENFSIVMLGVAPYITASIIFQLLGMIFPKLEEMNKEESGRQKIAMWSRWLTVPLAMIQAFSMISLIKSSSGGILSSLTGFDIFTAVVTITAGTVFVMWLGELIGEKKIGNGVSLMIFAGIISGLPGTMGQLLSTYDSSMIWIIAGIALIALATIVGVVIINEGQRNIPVQYARQMHGNRSFGGSSSILPLRVNMAGVMPIIFAMSILSFPQLIASLFKSAKTPFLSHAATWINNILNHQLVYGVLYFILVFLFTYFYTEIIFHPKQIAENLQKQGGFIPGIRPGKHTADYLSKTANKAIFAGALSLAILAVLPMVIRTASNMNYLKIGGTSILIVVGVVIDSVKQVEAQLSMREYDIM